MLSTRGLGDQKRSKTGQKCPNFAVTGPDWPLLDKVSIMSSINHSNEQHWATTTLIRQFSCRKVDCLPENGQNGPKNDPKVEKRAPEGPSVGKFVDFF